MSIERAPLSNPLVSIIIPTRNSSYTLGRCLDALRLQSYSNIETIVVDSNSSDNTLQIANRYSVRTVTTDWKLLGARYLGFKESTGDYALLLDSDQILHPETIQRLVRESEQYDMLCLEEESYHGNTWLEKLFAADRELINENSDMHLDPVYGVMLARFYKSEILRKAFANVPIDKLHDVVAHDHAIIYYEAYNISSRVGILKNAVSHMEPSSFAELWSKNYRYGKTTKDLLRSGLYSDLIKKKTRFRKTRKRGLKSLMSFFLLILKGVPYSIGLYF
jgi:glycosyltransferase involved in cell wall biosynthesis